MDGNLHDPDRHWLAEWRGCFTAEGGGMKDCACFKGVGENIGPETAATLILGPMPNTPVNLEVKMWGASEYTGPDERPPGF